MKIAGIDTTDWGLVPLSVQGAYNMPNRLPPYEYDWGDEIAPILQTELMSWEARNITVNFFYDPERQDPVYSTNYFDNSMQGFYNLDTTLELTEAVGSLGVHDITVLNIGPETRHRHPINTRRYHKVSINFHERVPAFNGVLPSLPGSLGNQALGGYNLSQFGIVVSSANDMSGIGISKELPLTVYLQEKRRAFYRENHLFRLNCYCIGISPSDLLQKISAFHKLLTSNSLLNLKYNELQFDTFAPFGFNAEKVSRKVLRFDLTLIRV